MRLLTRPKFLLLALLIVGGIGAYYYYKNSNSLQLPTNLNISTTSQHISQQFSSKVPADLSDQVNGIVQQGESLSKQAGAVLGTAVEKNEDAPIPQQAAEYARYLYCKQVVDAYESNGDSP